MGLNLAADLKCQSSLAHTTRTGEGEQSDLISQQQRANRGGEHLVERPLRFPEAAVRLVAERPELAIGIGRPLWIERGHHVGDEVIALVALRIDVQAGVPVQHAELRRRGEDEEVGTRALAVGEIVDRRDEALEDAVRRQPHGQTRMRRQARRELADERVAFGERR